MKKIVSLIAIGAMALAFCFNSALAKSADQEIPDRSGTYDVPGNPKLKVRVFVHYPKFPKVAEDERPACVVDDPDSSAIVDPTGWRLPNGNWSYNLNPGSVPSSVGSGNLATMSKDSFSRWSEAASGRVIFSRGADTRVSKKAYDRQNIIAWGSAPGSALAITYTWYYPTTGLVAEVDTIMNKKFSWSWTAYASGACPVLTTYDAQNILTHELGHWVGLNDHYTSDYKNNTMYGYGAKGEIKKDTLEAGDIAGTARIYP